MPKVILYQYLIAAVLFQRSQELWRIWGQESRNSVPPPFRQSGAIRKEARKYAGFSTREFRGERFAHGLNGGEGGIRTILQPSVNNKRICGILSIPRAFPRQRDLHVCFMFLINQIVAIHPTTIPRKIPNPPNNAIPIDMAPSQITAKVITPTMLFKAFTP